MKHLLRKLLPQELILKLKNIVSSFDSIIYPVFAKNSFLSSIYYCFFSTQFRREHQSVLQGRIKYQTSLNAIEQSSVLLRRNTHRLEKGLIMQPRRNVFAKAYILETVQCFRKCVNSQSICRDELKWAQDVLKKYFDIVGSSPDIDKARSLFYPIDLQQDNSATEFLPYKHQEREQSDISQKQLYQLFKQRRSVRWYEQKPVSVSLISKAIDMASQAPSACNRQPFQFYTITDMNKASDIASIAMGTTGFADNIPALLVVVGDLSAYPAERDRHVIYIDGGLASMQLMLALETLGLSSCPINWPDIEICEQKISKQLKLPKYLRPIMLISVGYGQATGQIPFSQKKNAETLLKEVH
jgi:nitroreductase